MIMWEVIESNRQKSIVLIALMAGCLSAVGYVVCLMLFPEESPLWGVGIAIVLWLVMTVVSLTAGDSILLSSSAAREADTALYPVFFNVAEEMKIAGNLPIMPKLYVIDEPAPNAFAAGIRMEKSAVAVTAGLLGRLDRDELQGVIAHEMSHIIHRDVQFMTIAGTLLGAITLIADLFRISTRQSLFSSRRYRTAQGGIGRSGPYAIVAMVVVLVTALLAALLARLFYFALSRKREYLADAGAVRLTRYPEGLASALEKISSANLPFESANRVTAPMFITNPLEAHSESVNLWSTHPPVAERINILRRIAAGASFLDYQNAFTAVKGEQSLLIPKSGLETKERIEIRPASVEKKVPDVKREARDVGDLMRAMNHFLFLNCSCGIRIKVPPDYERKEVICPRCMQTNRVPSAILKPERQTLNYTRQSNEWESFACACGKSVQLSPLFCGRRLECKSCGRTIEISEEKAAETGAR